MRRRGVTWGIRGDILGIRGDIFGFRGYIFGIREYIFGDDSDMVFCTVFQFFLSASLGSDCFPFFDLVHILLFVIFLENKYWKAIAWGHPVMVRSRVPSRPAGRDPGRDGTGFSKGIFEINPSYRRFLKITRNCF